MTVLPSRRDIDRAQPLEFRDAPVEKPTTITIEVAPDGLHVHTTYTGTLSSIPQAIERLKAAGVLELVRRASTPAAPAITPANIRPARKKKEKVEPFYNSEGDACCPVHRKVLLTGQYGLYCPSRATRDEPQNSRGYCSYSIED